MEAADKQDLEQRMQKTITVLNQQLQKIRTGRAHTSLLDDIEVIYHGARMRIQQLATVHVEDARTLNVMPWDQQSLPGIEKAIRDSDLGLNPVSAGTSIRVPLPVLTEETRGNYIRQAHQEAERARVAVRNIRRETLQQIKSDVESKDEVRRQSDIVQKATDVFIAKIDTMLQSKESDLRKI